MPDQPQRSFHSDVLKSCLMDSPEAAAHVRGHLKPSGSSFLIRKELREKYSAATDPWSRITDLELQLSLSMASKRTKLYDGPQITLPKPSSKATSAVAYSRDDGASPQNLSREIKRKTDERFQQNPILTQPDIASIRVTWRRSAVPPPVSRPSLET